ncbi:MAG: acetyl-CoA carboxylase biotin carboxyl carrier protein [Candidatus Margulisbacteria bacterium]|jgi:acetyl-CoA carboxylase biotin carboxyl carrier protein|nr:acetyl-CoA carboxylase biotin carboxyl carrier protein [Candidatus Margulisiibacteriota bacterium]
MDTERIKDLIKLVEQANITGLAVEEQDFKVEIRKDSNQPGAVQPSSAPAAPVGEPVKYQGSLTAIKAPMTGTFYAAAAPNDKPFIAVGDTVAQGQAVCVIEAMKTFNEIESEFSGAVEKILAQNAQTVELGQPLFLLRA